MTRNHTVNPHRPYLVVPKLIDQPTWGGQYIVTNKGWEHHEDLIKAKIGQSYELFSGSNLSLLDSSDDPAFIGEFTDRDAVQIQTHPINSIALADLQAATGQPPLNLLLKFTQALGNSFQAHIKTHVHHPMWKPKPESWYFFEPGLVTLGVKPGVDWHAYETAVRAIDTQMRVISEQVQSGALTFHDAQPRIQALLRQHDPWQFVNTLPVTAGQLIDLSAGGLHHSWEEDATQAPHGNVLYEIQGEALDDIATFRNFDKGKMEPGGRIRELRITEYFEHIDRSAEANDPASHVMEAHTLAQNDDYRLDRLLETPSYGLDKLTFATSGTSFSETPGRFKHLFVKAGKIAVTAGGHTVTVGTGHSCFIAAAAGEYTVKSQMRHAEVLISF